MSRTVVISIPYYIAKRGVSSIINDIEEVNLVFIDDIKELNQYLELNPVSAVIIDQSLLKNKQDVGLFFQLKDVTTYIAVNSSEDEQSLPHTQKFDYVIKSKGNKDKIFTVLENALKSKSKTSEASSILSERETEVLKLVALGYTNQQIAEKLYISKHTVISHRKNITSKLGIKTVSGLTVYAVLNNLIPKDQIQ